MNRQEVYKILDGERDYQDVKWGGLPHDEGHSVNDFIVYMQHYLTRSITEATNNWSNEKSLQELRKVVALGVACFEIHGVPERASETNWVTTITNGDSKKHTDLNHIIQHKDKVLDIYKKYRTSKKSSLRNTTITRRYTATTEVAVHTNGKDTVWESAKEFLDRLWALSAANVKSYDFGYIAGLQHPFGTNTKGLMSASNIDGYEMWEKVTFENEK